MCHAVARTGICCTEVMSQHPLTCLRPSLYSLETLLNHSFYEPIVEARVRELDFASSVQTELALAFDALCS